MDQTIALQVSGMHCASCVGRAERALTAQPGVIAAAVNLANGTAHVTVSAGNGFSLADALTAAGYPATVQDDPTQRKDHQAEARDMFRRFWSAFALTLPVFLIEMGGHAVPAIHHALHGVVGAQTLWLLQMLLIGLVLVWPGRDFFRIGLRALMRRAPEMNTLVALGAGAACGFSALVTLAPGLIPAGSRAVYFEAAGVIVTLILLGRALEARAKGRASQAIAALLTLQPDDAVVLDGDQAVTRPVSQLRIGDVLLARPGTRIAVDGDILTGTGDVDEAMLTGEAMPVPKSPGETLRAGTLNGSYALTYRATAVGHGTTLSRIIAAVDRAQAAKLPVQARIDRITEMFVPIVMGLALLAFLGWLLFGGTLAQALVALVSVLIIACPCAMGLATPVSIVVATGRAAQLGVLFRGGDGLERLAEVTTVAFDKTGTLTTGHPQVTEHHAPGDAKILADVAALEAQSEHPIARALVAAFAGPDAQVTEFQAAPGLGAEAQVNGTRVCVGTRRYMDSLGIEFAAFADLEDDMLSRGVTPVFAARDGRCAAIVGVADTVKPDARAAVAGLQSRGLTTAMISGDRRAVADAIAQELSINTVVADVLPDDKRTAVDAMRSAGTVAFVGDGLNDAPALASADVGIAIGDGTDVALEAADVVLLSPDLGSLVRARDLSVATLRNIRQNLFWAFAYNVALIPVAMGVFYPLFGWQLSPMLGAAAMALSSVFVVSNALRLRWAG